VSGKNDFNILIGVDMSNAESEIKESLKKISEGYKLQVSLLIANESSFINEIKKIQSLLNNIGKIDLSLGLDKVPDVGSQIQQQFKDAKNSAKTYNDEIEEGNRLLREQIKTLKNGQQLIKRTSGNRTEKTTKSYIREEGVERRLLVDEKVIDHEKARTDELKLQKTLAEQKLKLEAKALEIERQGIADKRVLNSYKNAVAKLNSEEIKDLEALDKQLQKINERYVNLISHINYRKFLNNRKDSVAEMNKKIKKIDPNVAGDALPKLREDIAEIGKAQTYEDLKRAIDKANASYVELIESQKKHINNLKEEERFANRIGDKRERAEIKRKAEERKAELAQAEAINKEVERIGLNQVRLNQATTVWERQLNEIEEKYAEVLSGEDLNGMRKRMSELNADSEKFDKELKAITKDIGDMDKRYEVLLDRQNRINQSTEEWLKEIRRIKQEGFIEDEEFENVRKMIASLRSDSKSFERDLNQVANTIKRLNTLSVKRQARQESIDISKARNDERIEKMRGVVPDSILNNVKSLNELMDFTSSKKDIAMIEDEMKKLVRLHDDIVKAGKEQSKINELIEKYKLNSVKATDKLNDSVQSIISQSERLIKDESRRNELAQEALRIQQQINALRERGTEITYREQRAIQEQIGSLRSKYQSFRDTESQETNRLRTIQHYREKLESYSYRATRGFSETSSQRAELKKIIDEIDALAKELPSRFGNEFNSMIKEIDNRLNTLNRRARELREEDQRRRSSPIGTLEQAFKKVPMWSSAVGVFYGTLHQIQQGFQQILEIDKAMINLAKVTEASNQELEQFRQTASAMGKELGVVASDIIKATTEFQRLGYTLEEATILGKNSILYANVGDMDVEAAGENIVATIKGFGIEVDKQGDNVRAVVDMFNEVSNNFAISAEGIGEGLKRSSAVLHEAGNSIEESIALLSAANAVIQDPKKVGNGLKTIAMRLRGVSEEGENLAKLVPQLQSLFERLNEEYALTGENRLELMKEDGKTFKSTYEIFENISKIWDKLSDIEQANLVEMMGGKHQGVIVASIINNWKDAQSAMETAMNSAGSATREFEKYTEGYEYRIGRLQNALERFWTTLVNDDAVKNMIDALTKIIELMTELVETVGGGRLLTFFTAIGGLFFSRGLRDAVKSASSFAASLKNISTWTLAAGRSLMRFIPYVGAIMAIGEAINFVASAMTAEQRRRKQYIKQLDDEISKLRELKDAYHDLFDKNADGDNIVLDRFGELQTKGDSRTKEEQEEFEKLSREIAEKMPDLIAYYDEYRNAVIKTADEIRRLRYENSQLLLQTEKEHFDKKLKDEKFKELNSSLENLKTLDNQIDGLNNVKTIVGQIKTFFENELANISDTRELLATYQKEVMDAYMTLPKEQQELAGKYLLQIQEYPSLYSKEKMSEALNTFMKNIEAQKEAAKKAKENLETTMRSEMDTFSSMLDQAFSIRLRELGIDSNTNKYKFLYGFKKQIEENIQMFGDDAKKIIGQVPEIIDNAIKTVEQKGIDFDKLLTIDPKSAEETIRIIESIIKSLNPDNLDVSSLAAETQAMINMLVELRESHRNAYLEMKNRPIKPFNFQTDVVQETQDFIDEIKSLDSAYRQLSKSEELSIDNIMDLISEYPELIKYLEEENGVLKLTKESLKDVAKVREEIFKATLRQRREEREAAKQQALEEIEYNRKAAESYKQKYNVMALSSGDRARLAELEEELLGKKQYPFVGNEKKSPLDSWTGNWSNTDLTKIQELRSLNERVERMKEYNDLKAKEKAAEATAKAIQDEIDKMDMILNQDFTSMLGKITGNDKDKNKNIRDGYYVVDQYAKAMQELNAKIEEQQRLQAKNNQWSDIYRQSLSEEIKLTNQKKKTIDDEIASLKRQIEARNIQKKGLVVIDSNGNENKTARLLLAEIEQEIDQARDRLAELERDSATTADRIIELQANMFRSRLEYYNIQREMLTDDIAYQEYAMSLYDETSEAYRKHANEKLALLNEQMKYHKDELLLLEQERSTNKNLTNAQIAELNELIRAKREAVLEMATTIQELNDTIAKSKLNEYLYMITSESEKYAKEIEKINDQIKYNVDKDKIGDYQEHISYLQQILALRKGEANDARSAVKYLKEQLEKYKDSKEMVEKITDEIENWEDRLEDAERAIKDVNLEIKDIFEQLADDYVEMYKEQLRLMQEADNKYYENKIKQQEKAHEKLMKDIERELRALEDAYNKQMKMIDREESTRMYNNDLQRLEQEADELKKQIDLLSMDDSYEAKSKRADLTKQLTEKEMQITELKYKREIELRKNNLQDEYESEREKLETKRDRLNEEHQRLVEALEKEAEIRQKYWEEELQNERKFAELRRQVLEGNFDEMLLSLETWQSNVTSRMAELGDIITTNFTDKIRDAIDALTELKNANIGSFNGIVQRVNPVNLDGDPKPQAGVPKNNELKNNDAELSTITKMKANSDEWLRTSDEKRKKELHEENLQLGKKIGAVFKDGVWYDKYGKRLYDKLIGLRTGGYTGDWSGDEGRLALLHKKELVLDKTQTGHILDTARIVEKIKSVLPNLNYLFDFFRKPEPVVASGTTEHNEYNIYVTVQGNADKNVADIVAKQIVNDIKRTRGGRF